MKITRATTNINEHVTKASVGVYLSIEMTREQSRKWEGPGFGQVCYFNYHVLFHVMC